MSAKRYAFDSWWPVAVCYVTAAGLFAIGQRLRAAAKFVADVAGDE